MLRRATPEALNQFITSVGGVEALLWTVLEAAEFVNILTAFDGEWDDRALRNKIKLALDGPVDLLSETHANNCARNTLFELTFALMLKLRGISADLHSDCDLRFSLQDLDCLVQAKRPYSESAAGRNLLKAASQLTRNLSQPEFSRFAGIIVISTVRSVIVDRCALDSTHLSHSYHGVDGAITRFQAKLQQQVRTAWSRHPRIIAVVFLLNAPVVIDGAFVRCASFSQIAPRPGLDSRTRTRLQQLRVLGQDPARIASGEVQ
ncbi:MAG: hypothetical protein AB1758_08620 [Candidatus Eremiobacterota bacterium]